MTWWKACNWPKLTLWNVHFHGSGAFARRSRNTGGIIIGSPAGPIGGQGGRRRRRGGDAKGRAGGRRVEEGKRLWKGEAWGAFFLSFLLSENFSKKHALSCLNREYPVSVRRISVPVTGIPV